MAVEKRLLIIDDEPEIREFLQYQTQNLASHVTLAADGFEALEATERIQFDAILSDIRMPNMSGLEFLTAIRKQGIETPLVILTSFGDKQLAIEALKLGAFDFLDKPWEETGLVEVMGRALELGAELNYWKNAGATRDSLNRIQSENSSKSVAFLERVLGLVVKESQALKRNIKP